MQQGHPIHISGDAADWDDSECVAAWDDAVREYKKYHSVRARGLSADEAIAQFQAEAAGDAPMADPAPTPAAKDGGAAAEEAPAAEKAPPAETEAAAPGTTRQQAGVDSPLAWRAVTSQEAVDVEKESPSDGIATEGATRSPPAPARPKGGETSLLGGAPGAPPNFAINMIKDEAVKNLVMSWYYAGYYSGYYEGQRAAASVATDAPHQ